MAVVAWVAFAASALSYYYAYVIRALVSPGVSLELDVPEAVAALLLIGSVMLAMTMTAALAGQVRGFLMTRASARIPSVIFGAAGLLVVPWWRAADGFQGIFGGADLPLLPFAGEAAARAVHAIVGALLVWLGALAAGTLLLRALRLQTTSTAEYLVFASSSGVLILSCLYYAMAAAGAYGPLAVAVSIAAMLLGGAAVARPAQAVNLPDTVESDRASRPWLAVALVAMAFGLVASLAPEKEYDALWYHLNLPRLWLEAGRPVDLVHEYVSLYPMTWELVFGAGLVLGGAVGAKLLHFICLPLLASIVWSAARRYLPTSPAVAVALTVTAPTLLWESSTAYVDLALAFQTAAASYALARYAETNERAWAVMAALQFGGAAATKHLGAIFTMLALAAYVSWSWWRGSSPIPAARRALLIGVAAALIPLPWYARSAIASGNPVFPELFSLFGAFPPERWDALTERGLDGFKSRFGIGRSWIDLLRLPWDVTVHGARFGGSIGPLFLLLVPAAWLARRHRRAVGLLSAFVAAYVLVWASPVSSFQMRFLMPIVAPAALLAAAGLDALASAAARWTPRARHGLAGLVFLIAVGNLPPFTRWHERDREGWSGFLTHVLRQSPIRVVLGRQSEAEYLRRELPAFEAWQALNTSAPPDARVLTFVGGDHFYARRRRVSYDATAARPAVGIGRDDPDAAVRGLRRLGITHVLFDRRELTRIGGEALAIGSQPFQQACDVVYDDRRVWVCAIDYRRLPQR